MLLIIAAESVLILLNVSFFLMFSEEGDDVMYTFVVPGVSSNSTLADLASALAAL